MSDNIVPANLETSGYLRQAEEVAQFSQSTQLEVCVKNFGRDVVRVGGPAKDSRNTGHVKKHRDVQYPKRCYLCGFTGHLKTECSKKFKKEQDADFVMAVHGDRKVLTNH